MLHQDIEIKSLGDLVKHLTEHKPQDQPMWFRGQANSKWNLRPSLARCGGIDREIPLINRFKQNALPYMEVRPKSEWEWLVVMRHHGLPSRLLDWTESLLVGLYFAVNDPALLEQDKEGTLWAILPMNLNEKSILHRRDIPLLEGADKDDESLIHMYLPKKPKEMAKLTDSYSPIAAIAMRNTRRMQAQKGVFTIHDYRMTALDKLDNKDGGNYIWSYIIPGQSKAEIRKELDILNITKFAIFPELSSVAEHAKDTVR